MAPSRENGVYYSGYNKSFYYVLDGAKSDFYEDKHLCGDDYARQIVKKNPKFAPLIQGKKRGDIYRILGIKV